MQRLRNILSFKYLMGGYFKASSLRYRGYSYIEALKIAEMLYRGADLRNSEGVMAFIVAYSAQSSIYSK